MNIKEQIKAEIDKRYAEYREKMKTDDFTYYEGMADALDLFEQFIDSLPETSGDLEKAGCGMEFPHFGAQYPDAKCIDGYLWDLDSYEEGLGLTSGGDDPCPFCNTAAWLDEVVGTLFDSRDEAIVWLQKMRQKYDHTKSSEKPMNPSEHCDSCGLRGPSGVDGDKNWYLLDREIIDWCGKFNPSIREEIQSTAYHFADWQKEQMLRDAVETVVHLEPGANPVIEFGVGRFGLKVRDKVKVVIVKEDEK